MQLVGLGIDIAERSRHARLLRRPRALLQQVFTTDELSVVERSADPLGQLVACFALKEAAQKAIGHGWLNSGLFWTDIELLSDWTACSPDIRVSGDVRRSIEAMQVTQLHASFSAGGGVIIALLQLFSPLAGVVDHRASRGPLPS